MTGGAVLRERGGGVGRQLCFGEIRLVAGNAVGAEPLELAGGGAFVAGIALRGGVRVEQRETVGVLQGLLDGGEPAADGMALFAVLAHLAAVQVPVTGGAVGAGPLEDRMNVTMWDEIAQIGFAEQVHTGAAHFGQLDIKPTADGNPGEFPQGAVRGLLQQQFQGYVVFLQGASR